MQTKFEGTPYDMVEQLANEYYRLQAHYTRMVAENMENGHTRTADHCQARADAFGRAALEAEYCLKAIADREG